MGSNRKNIYHEDHEEKPNRAQIKTDDTDKWETKRLFTMKSMKVMKISICRGQIDKIYVSFVLFVVIVFLVLPFMPFMNFMVEKIFIFICFLQGKRGYPPKAASSIATAASEQSSMAAIFPSVTGKMVRMKNSAVLICPS